MSENLAGETLIALGNGAPDLFTSLAVAINMDFKSGHHKHDFGFILGELLGSGMFVTTVIIAVIICIKPFRTLEGPLLRVMIFYLISIYLTFFVLWDGEITRLESICKLPPPPP